MGSRRKQRVLLYQPEEVVLNQAVELLYVAV